MLELCDAFDLKTLKHGFDYTFVKRGLIQKPAPTQKKDWPFSSKAAKAFERLRKEFKAHGKNKKTDWSEKLDLQDWWTVLRDRGYEEDDLLTRDLMDSTDFGESIRHVGGYSGATEYFQGDNTDEMDFKIKGGNSRLVNALADAIGQENIRISEEVTSIRQPKKGKGRVLVATKFTRSEEFPPREPSKGLEYVADACICTVPARVLRKIEFSPNLSPEKRQAAESLEYCRIMKTVVLFDERFWMESRGTRFSCFTDSASDFLFDATLNQEGNAGILCSYAIGDKADDQSSAGPERLRERLEGVLSLLFPGSNPKAVGIHRYAWQKDEYTEGAYALFRPGQWFSLRKALQEPHHNIYFAGEHLADWQGFMEGAVDTGRDAALGLP